MRVFVLNATLGLSIRGSLRRLRRGHRASMLVNPHEVSRKGLENIGEQPRRGRRIAIW